MDASPTLDAPRKGDPITADWAARVADAANAVPRTPQTPGAFASPFGSVPALSPQQMLGNAEMRMPFDCRLVWDGGASENHIHCFLPSFGSAGATSNLVSLYGEMTRPDSSQSIGATNPWVDCGAVADDSKTRYLTLWITPPTDTSGALLNTYRWRLDLAVASASGYPTRPSWAWKYSPYVIVAAHLQNSNGTDKRGFVQFHRGVVTVGTPTWAPYGGYGTQIDRNVVVAMKTGLIKDNAGNRWLAPGEIWDGADQYTPTTITYKDGNDATHTIKVWAV